MADQEVVKHVKHAVDVARPKKPWTHKLQEILGIWLHNWSERSKDREEEPALSIS